MKHPVGYWNVRELFLSVGFFSLAVPIYSPLQQPLASASPSYLPSFLKLLEQEMESGSNYDVLLAADLHPRQIPPTYTAGFQLAVEPAFWTSINMSNLEKSTVDIKIPVILYFLPSSKALLYSIVDHISAHFTMVDTAAIKSRRIFVICWPQEISLADMEAELREQKGSFSDSVQSVHLDDEIYIVGWTAINDTLIRFHSHILEIYGVQNSIPVIQTVRLNNDVRMGGKLGLDPGSLLPISVRRRNLKGASIKAVGQDDSTYSAELEIAPDQLNGGIKFVRGSSKNLLDDFAFNLNFTYEPVNGNGWIGRSQGGLTGMGQQLLENEADIIVSTSSMEDYRAEYIRFLQPINSEEAHVFFRQPSVTSVRTIFILPFSISVWFYILLVWICMVGVGIAISCPIERPFRHIGTGRMFKKYQMEGDDDEMSTVDVFLWASAVLCQQGWSRSILRGSLRILCLTALMTSLLLYAYYTGAFVATISQPSPPVQRFGDLYTYQFHIIANPGEPAYLSGFVRNDGEKERILMSSSQFFHNESNAVGIVVEGRNTVALIVVIDTFYATALHLKYKDHELCLVEKLAGNRGVRIKDAMIVRKQSEFKEHFGHETVVSIERGIAHRYWLASAKEVRLQCLQNTMTDVQLDLHKCYPAFVILSSGYFLALLFTVWEKRGRWSSRSSLLS